MGLNPHSAMSDSGPVSLPQLTIQVALWLKEKGAALSSLSKGTIQVDKK